MIRKLVPVLILVLPLLSVFGCGEKEEPFSTEAPKKESKVETVKGEEGKATTQDSLTE